MKGNRAYPVDFGHPLAEKEIFFKRFYDEVQSFTASTEVHIVASVFRNCVWVKQYDTCDQVWGLFGDGFHEICVDVLKGAIEEGFGTTNPEEIVEIIARRFGGPHAIRRFAAYCRRLGGDFSIHESGPQRDNLIRRFYPIKRRY